MDYVNLGTSGLKVSRICLGCMSYGDPKSGHHAWALGEAESRPFISRALELGINFFDTANMYSSGASEEVLGRAVRDFAKRDDVVIATKAYYPMRKGDANAPGLSRKALFREIEDSLRRLGTDYVDLYQIHRWDYTTPVEETLEALHDIVKAGKARYIGASTMHAWQFAKALYLADIHGWTRFVSMQPHYNLLYREEEREMLPLCKAEGIGVIPWSPLARGRLSRPWKAEETARARSDSYSRVLYEASEATASSSWPLLVAPTMGAVTAPLPSIHAKATWAMGRPRASATAARRSTTARSASSLAA
jgi:aryl-alcohol dehydrogenase-like predicted oxidoreductase